MLDPDLWFSCPIMNIMDHGIDFVVGSYEFWILFLDVMSCYKTDFFVRLPVYMSHRYIHSW